MRLDRVYIDGFKNLKKLEVYFDEARLTTVIIGQNGTGKSNLIEAITDVFRFVDLNRGEPRFIYEIDYKIGNHSVRLTNKDSRPSILIDGMPLSRAAFEASQTEFFPDLVFGYYSGGSRRMEKLFDFHQRGYYTEIIKEEADFQSALRNRRLFYCRPIHGIFALLAFFAFPEPAVASLLEEKLGITGFHSMLALFKEPYWFTAGRKKSKRPNEPMPPVRGRRSYNELAIQAFDLWNAKGKAGECTRALLKSAFHPMALQDNVIDDYRDKQQTEVQLACFLRNHSALDAFKSHFTSDQDMFAALEAVDISDLLRDIPLWVTRTNDTTGNVSFADLSDGERQLLMVLGLIRVSRNKRALFLLDEPDTHLNPVWQYNYLDLIERWTEIGNNAQNCNIILSTHNPLVIGGLRKSEVRVLLRDEEGIIASEPEDDPIGIGIEGLLKSELYGLRSTLAPEVLDKIDRHYKLLGNSNRTNVEDVELRVLAEELNELAVSRTHPNPYFESFAKAIAQRQTSTSTATLTKSEIDDQTSLANTILKELIDEGKSENKGASE